MPRSESCDVVLLGASTRAAAFSAMRAGLQPLCADLFADADLTLRCRALPPASYPELVEQLLRLDRVMPWMYTGGLENRPDLIETLARRHPLWGNNADILSRCRSPGFIHRLLTAAGLPCPAVRNVVDLPSSERWLVKPLQGAGGRGIRFWKDREPGPKKHIYAQEYVDGLSSSALYLGDGAQAQLLGVTRQLVGEAWLHAAPFRYCGSIGRSDEVPGLQPLGDLLTKGCGLRGLFGVDFIERDGEPWPVEVNPRYTASVEVLEYATGLPAIALHRAAFLPSPRRVGPRETQARSPHPQPLSPAGRGEKDSVLVGKAILFAPIDFTFPDNSPWLRGSCVDRLPGFADIPPSGQNIRKGQPVLSFFTSGNSIDACRQALQEIAAGLDRQLFPGYKEDN